MTHDRINRIAKRIAAADNEVLGRAIEYIRAHIDVAGLANENPSEALDDVEMLLDDFAKENGLETEWYEREWWEKDGFSRRDFLAAVLGG